MISGRIGPRILVNNDMTKNVRKTNAIMYLLLAIRAPSPLFRLGRTLHDFSEPMMPDHRRPDQVRIPSERGEQQLRLFKWNEAATLADGLANAIEKKIRTLHDAAA